MEGESVTVFLKNLRIPAPGAEPDSHRHHGFNPMIPVLWRHDKEESMQKITPFLWFNNQAEEAVNFYLSVFERSKIIRVTRYGKEGQGPPGQS